MIVIGTSALKHQDGAAILALAQQIAEKYKLVREDWNGFNVLHQAAARVGGLDVGFVPQGDGKNVEAMFDAIVNGGLEVVYLLNADEINMEKLGNAFVIYQGHHGDAGAHRADVIFPGAAYTEKSATYVNTEGRAQRTALAAFPPGEAVEDWKIIRKLSDVLAKTLPYNTTEAIQEKLATVLPSFDAIGEVVAAEWKAFGKTGAVGNKPFEKSIENFYMTDPISRASKTMAKCTAQLADMGDKEAA